MGNIFTKNKNGNAKQCNGKEKNTETQLDSIQVHRVLLPILGEINNVNLGLVNSVFDETEKLIRDNNLNIPASECILVMRLNSGDTVIMEGAHHIEHYKDNLNLQSTVVQLIHNVPEQKAAGDPTMSDLNVAVK